MAIVRQLDFQNCDIVSADKFRQPSCFIIKNSRRSVKTLPRYGHLSIFKITVIHHLGFLKVRSFNCRYGLGVKMRHRAKFHANADIIYGDFRFFQNCSHPPSLIYYTRVWATHEDYLLVVATVQNVVGFVAVVSTIRKFRYCARSA